MVKFLKPNKVVILMQGRYAGRKAYPAKVIKKDSATKTAKKSRVKALMKVVNCNHLMLTRYTLDVDLKDVATLDALVTKDKKVTRKRDQEERQLPRHQSLTVCLILLLREGLKE
ncbi:60S ribosomal protein L27e, putative [Ricinus communis]|uniref:60S ribosomal protein L27e, putative n=1 Tax=Ricinus communis TaxID=3988 RepID=B9T2Q3_RICCO|nr:60S ribosomal protein L27e, putative [Ricinus communis]